MSSRKRRNAPLRSEGPAIAGPVAPQVRPDDLKSLGPRSVPGQWRPGDPVTIIEDLKETPVPPRIRRPR